MKMFVILVLLLQSAVSYSQSSVTPTATGALNPANTSQVNFPSLSWEKIRSKLKINYFNFATGPSLKKWDDNEISDQGTKNREPVTMYHSFNVRILTGEKFNLFLVPRFDNPMGDRNDLKENQDHHVFMADDLDIGFYYTFIGKHEFNYAQALTRRLPYSTKSRNENIDSMYVWQHLVNWAITPAWRLLHWNTYTYYDFNKNSTIDRYRINWRTILNYSFNDRWSTQVSYELDIQHIGPNRSSAPRQREWNFMQRYHSYTTLGIGYTPIPNWTILPYIRSQDERNIRNETTVLGFMLMGKII